MSQENVERFGQLIEALNAADLEGLYACFDPDLVYYSRADEPDAIVGGGLDQFKEMIVTWTAMFEEFRCDIEESVDAGDRTVSVTVLRGRGREGGVAVEEPYVFVVTWRNGRAIEVHEYRTKKEALEAAGLTDWQVALLVDGTTRLPCRSSPHRCPSRPLTAERGDGCAGPGARGALT